jgi:hypothetical protein
VAGLCILGAIYVTQGLWRDPGAWGLTHNGSDQVFFEWLLGDTARSVAHLHNPLWTSMVNMPIGVNLASNTAVTVIGVLLTPITLLFGSSVAFATAIALNLAATGYAWYWLFSRHVARTRTAAITAGIFCGFAPGMIAHANGHLNFTAGWIIPLLLWRLVCLTRPNSRIGDGVWVGLLGVVQYSLSAEMLFFTTVAVFVFVIVWTIQRPREARAIAPRAARHLAVGAALGGALLAYPIWMQFAGPATYHGTGFAGLGVWEDLLAFAAYPWESLAGGAGLWHRLALNYAEEDTFFGPVLFAAVVFAAYRWNRRSRRRGSWPGAAGRAEVRALTVTTLVIMVLALGSRLHLGGWHSPVPLPWAALGHLPFFDSALPGRFGLLLIPIVALVMVRAVDHALSRPRGARIRFITLFVGLAALVPLFPRPLPVTPRAPLPHFITSGEWRHYLPAGTTMVSIPPASWDTFDAQRWQVATDYAFPIEGGYFLGPNVDGRSTIGPVMRPASALLTDVARYGKIAVVTDAYRDAARVDLAYWHAGLLVLPDPTPGQGHMWGANYHKLLDAATLLFGTPIRVDDVWIWPIKQPVR